MANNDSLKRRWLYLAVGGVGLLFIGVLYAWSIFKVPLRDTFLWTDSQLSLAYTLIMCAFCLCAILGGFLMKRIPLWSVFSISALMILIGYIWTVNLTGNILGLYLAYSVLIGGGIGISYNTLVSLGNAWFPDQKGTASGIMMMCFGLSTLVLGTIADKLFQMPQVGWQKTFLGLGILIAVILVVCAVVLKMPAEGTQFPAPKTSPKRKEAFEPRDYTTLEMLGRASFWISYIYGILHATVGSAMFNFAREVTMDLGATAAFATTLVGFLSVCNGLGRVFCGLGFDYLGRKTTMHLANIITMASPALMLVALSAGSLALGAVSVCLAGISYGTSPTISAALTSGFYGSKNFAMNYSTTNTKLLFSAFAATATSALLQSTGTYVAPFVLLLVMATVAFGLNFFIRKP